MVDALVAGAVNLIDDRVAAGKRTGATYRLPSARWRKVWHTTEVVPSNIAGAVSMAIRHDNPPHLWAWPEQDWLGQTVPLNLSAYALEHDPGDPETNHAHAIQTEVIGLASQDPLMRAEITAWLGRRVLRAVLGAGVPLDLSQACASTGSDGAGENGKVRITWAAWTALNGQCGHANVPGNQHWDPGRADYHAIARAAAPVVPPPPPPKHGGKMLYYVQVTGTPAVYVTDWLTKRVVNAEDQGVILFLSTVAGQPVSRATGGKPHQLSAAQADVLTPAPQRLMTRSAVEVCPLCKQETATVNNPPRFVAHDDCAGGYALVDLADTVLESRYTDARADCPHPERWHSADWDSTEFEVTELVAAFVGALRPDIVVETGTAFGQTAVAVGKVLAEAGVGEMHTVEIDPARAAFARDACEGLPVKVHECDSMTFTPPSGIGFAWFDSLLPLRVPEFQAYYPSFAPGAIVGFHDTGTHYDRHGLWASIEALEAEGKLLPIRLPTPRGVVFGEVL